MHRKYSCYSVHNKIFIAECFFFYMIYETIVYNKTRKNVEKCHTYVTIKKILCRSIKHTN